MIHGGAGSQVPNLIGAEALGRSLHEILADSYRTLVRTKSAARAVVRAVELLENDPFYNAGLGSKLHSDGKIRMSASLMDGHLQRFSGCVSVEKIKNPILLAEKLQTYPDRVIAGEHALVLAKKWKLKLASNYTEIRRAEFLRVKENRSSKKSASTQFDSNTATLEALERKLAVQPTGRSSARGLARVSHLGSGRASKRDRMGTVGAVAIDAQGRLAAATSTGGRGFESPGRVSDSPTIAGNFANPYCALSATGVGEEIVDFGLGARVATYCELGHSLKRTSESLIAMATAQGFEFGFIALNRAAHRVAVTSTRHLIWGAALGSNEFEIHP